MVRPAAGAATNCAARQVAILIEIWCIIAEHSGFVGAWRLTGVCKAARQGAIQWLRTLPGLVVFGGNDGSDALVEVLKLNLATLGWEPMPSLNIGTYDHACCSVRGALVVFGGTGEMEGDEFPITSRVGMISAGSEVFTKLPPMPYNEISGAAAIAVDESGEFGSAAGQVLLIGGTSTEPTGIEGFEYYADILDTVHLVDLATGVCTPQAALLSSRVFFAAAQLPDGRVVCAGGYGDDADLKSLSSAEIFGPGTLDGAWAWTRLPAMIVSRVRCRGCVMSDGRFAVLGGETGDHDHRTLLPWCEALVIDDGGHWDPLPSMHAARADFACAVVAGCIIVAGGDYLSSAEVYDEALGRWLRLPCDLPNCYVNTKMIVQGMGSALL